VVRAMRAAANGATQAEKFVIPQNMPVPESSVVRPPFDAEIKRNAPNPQESGIRGARLATGLRGVL
jgi:hypothetical protein